MSCRPREVNVENEVEDVGENGSWKRIMKDDRHLDMFIRTSREPRRRTLYAEA